MNTPTLMSYLTLVDAAERQANMARHTKRLARAMADEARRAAHNQGAEPPASDE